MEEEVTPNVASNQFSRKIEADPFDKNTVLAAISEEEEK